MEHRRREVLQNFINEIESVIIQTALRLKDSHRPQWGARGQACSASPPLRGQPHASQSGALARSLSLHLLDWAVHSAAVAYADLHGPFSHLIILADFFLILWHLGTKFMYNNMQSMMCLLFWIFFVLSSMTSMECGLPLKRAHLSQTNFCQNLCV